MKTEMRRSCGVEMEYHADDYGLFPTQSERILDCYHNGCLNGVSIFSNSPHLESCMQMLEESHAKIQLTVHLNIMEGRCLASAEEVPLLVNQDGVFRAGFGSLLLHSFLYDRKQYYSQLKKELKAQILAAKPYFNGEPLRLDGHAHYHMVPVVFDAMMDVIREENLDVSYIRIPREYLSLYFRHRECLRDVSPINLVKVGILNILALRNGWKHRELLSKMEKKLFMGVFLSGCMYYENISPVLPDARALALGKQWGLEVLAHPGGVYEAEDIRTLTNQDDIRFLTSKQRRREAGLFQLREGVVAK